MLFLNSTLERIIQRFEDEYPECRLAKEKEAASAQAKQENSSSESESKSQPSASLFKDPFANGEKLDAEVVNDELADDEDEPRPPLSRHGSDVSLALRNLTSEEGQMHRFGQQVRRSMLKEHEKAVNPDDPAVDTISREQIDSLRQKMESLSGAQMREKISELGTEGYLAHLGANAQELKLLKEDDPEGFEKFRVAQKHAQETMGGGKEAHAGHQHNESESTVA